jgi:hypothetical protein
MNPIISEMRKQYLMRLVENLGEADIFDKRGNMLLSKDLKITHEDSGFEYTVDRVKRDPATGKILIYLRTPEEPRFDAPGEHGLITQDSDVTTPIEYKDEVPDDDVFIISQEDFEKEYEVQ